MHEMSIAQSLIEIIQEEMDRHGAVHLRTVHLQVGEMSAVVPESLAFSFEVITAGTPLEGARLVIETVPLEGNCKDCGKPFKIKDYVFLCPACGSTRVDTVAGQELSLVDMEVE
jgi:hydrogenase nickel incorporation protein HypA/HybF